MDRIIVKAPGEADGPQVVEVERHPEGWITTDARPLDSFEPGRVELRLVSGSEGIDFIEGAYEATVGFAGEPRSREQSRVLFAGPGAIKSDG
jgi:hypothetical protein